MLFAGVLRPACSDWALRRFFAYGFARWDSRFAVLFGDASDDPRGEMAVSDQNWMPTHPISAPVPTTAGQELSPSEIWYVNDLDDSFADFRS